MVVRSSYGLILKLPSEASAFSDAEAALLNRYRLRPASIASRSRADGA